jgi:hypothetical protein
MVGGVRGPCLAAFSQVRRINHGRRVIPAWLVPGRFGGSAELVGAVAGEVGLSASGDRRPYRVHSIYKHGVLGGVCNHLRIRLDGSPMHDDRPGSPYLHLC